MDGGRRPSLRQQVHLWLARLGLATRAHGGRDEGRHDCDDRFSGSPPESVQFYLLTVSGVRTTAEANENDLGSKHALSPLFYAGQEVITQLRLISEER